jgi:N-methylhydantoinase B
VVAAQLRAVTVHMSNALMRSARSTLINSARDFSSALLTADARALVIDEGLPVHAGSAHLVPLAILDLFDDIAPGDCYLTNSPFYGNTHHADFTLCSPVFAGEEIAFWVLSRAHQADVGAPQPSTYLPFAATAQEEGVHIPCVRVRRDDRECRDVMRFVFDRVRVPELGYADHLAQVGSLRVGATRLAHLVDRYGAEALKEFAEDWIRYGDRMMRAEIAQLPRGSWTVTCHHDPTPFAPRGIPVRATVSVQPAAGRITVDLRDNVDNVAGGLNLTEATTLAAAYGGVLNNLSAEVPRNAGSLSRIQVEMRSGSVVGVPRPGAGTSVATTNVCDRLFNAVQSAFAGAGPPFGMAEGSTGMLPSFSVISGRDPRKGFAYFVNQTIIGCGGGPAVHGHDGWLTYNKPVTGAVERVDSVEMNEMAYPVLYRRIEIAEDSGGAGTWRGAPGVDVELEARFDEVHAHYVGDSVAFAPQGVNGGHPGVTARAALRAKRGAPAVDLPPINALVLEPGEVLVSRWAGGGGYGCPRERDPEAVVRDLNEGIISERAARETYAVAVRRIGDGVFALDHDATSALRSEVRE